MSKAIKLSLEGSNEEQYKKLVRALLPLPGTIIRDDGTTIDISEIVGIEPTDKDAQVEKAFPRTPYIRDRVILEGGRVTSLEGILRALKADAEGYATEEWVNDNFTDNESLELLLQDKADVSDLVDIEANPEEPATDTLEKIGIDGTVYDLGGNVDLSPYAKKLDVFGDNVTVLCCDIPANSTEFSLALGGYNAQAIVDWGDGTTSVAVVNRLTSHIYENLGTYVVTVTTNQEPIQQGYLPNTTVAFYVKSIEIAKNGTYIGAYAFQSAPIKQIRIPYGITRLEGEAFRNCTPLKYVIIPRTVTTIEYGCFYGCTSLTSVYFEGTKAEWDAITIGSDNTPLQNAKKYFLTDGSEVEANNGETASVDLATLKVGNTNYNIPSGGEAPELWVHHFYIGSMSGPIVFIDLYTFSSATPTAQDVLASMDTSFGQSCGGYASGGHPIVSARYASNGQIVYQYKDANVSGVSQSSFTPSGVEEASKRRIV